MGVRNRTLQSKRSWNKSCFSNKVEFDEAKEPDELSDLIEKS